MKYIIFSLTILFLFSCATEVPPTGGEVDQEPPVLNYRKSIPDTSHLTNFNSNEVILVFDEPISVSSFQQNFISNPTLKNTPKYKIKNNKLYLTIKDTLEENTTYIFTFNNCITDITEQNKIPQLNFAFSTGSYLDSLSVTGKIHDPYNDKNIGGNLVNLYRLTDTINILEHQPIYTTISNSDGTYKFNYLKPNNYLLVTYPKPKLNSKLTLPNQIGYDTVRLDSTTIETDINVFNQQHDSLEILSAIQKDYYLRIKTNKPLSTESTKYIITKNTDMDYYQFVPYLNITDTINPITIKSQNQQIDTLIKYEQYTDTITNNIQYNYLQNDKTINIIVQSTLPITYNKDSVTLVFNNTDTVTISHTKNKYFCNDTIIIPNKNYSSIVQLIDSNLYKSNYLIDNQYINKSQPLLTEQTSGIISGKINSQQSNYIFQLIDSKGLIIKELHNPKSFRFEFLKPDIYTYRIILDSDQDKQFSEGNIFTQKQPEKVIHSKEPITLKANWEIDNVSINIE